MKSIFKFFDKDIIKNIYYYKFRIKIFKLSNFETPSANYANPFDPIPFKLKNYNNQYRKIFFNNIKKKFLQEI
jgi:hypothetical protein